jgi:signal transduction histidine kinase/ActR/RegA family two-component response regulator
MGIAPELQHFAEMLPEAILLLNIDARIEFANHSARELLAGPAESLAGRSLLEFVVDGQKVSGFLATCARTRELLPGAIAWKGPKGEIWDRRVDGAVLLPRTASSPASLLLRCRPVPETPDQFALLNEKILALSKEIMERKKAEAHRDELLVSEHAARLEAERINRMKDEFLATLSHELRTPLQAVLGWCRLLSSSEQTGERLAKGLEVIDRNTRAQVRLVEDLLDMSGIISGKTRLDAQRVELAPIIDAAAAAVRNSADAKGIRLQIVVDPLAQPVRGDPARLQQIFWNLLTNAIKFTPKGGRVQISLERVNSHLEITVADTGEGIKPDFLPYVFDRFRQADSTSTRRHGGLGLGLSLVKQLTEMHGGTVRAKSPGEGRGAVFSIALPSIILHDLNGERPEKMHPQAAEARSELCDTITLKGLTVLVVDDEPDARQLITHLLEQCHAEVLAASSAQEALSLFRGSRPNVLVSDIGMPETDGHELIRQVRALPKEDGGDTPAIALTAFARSEDRTRSILAGFQMHLSKPIEPSEFIAVVASLCGRAQPSGSST